MTNSLLERRRMVQALGWAMVIAVFEPGFAWSQSISTPLAAGAKVLRSETVSIAAERAAGSDIFTPSSGLFILDYAVERGKEIMITMATGEQYAELSAGRKPTGKPLIKATVSGVGQRTVHLQRGTYFIGFNNNGGTTARIVYRACLQGN